MDIMDEVKRNDEKEERQSRSVKEKKDDFF